MDAGQCSQKHGKILPVSDGKIPVSAGYTIESAFVEPYKE